MKRTPRSTRLGYNERHAKSGLTAALPAIETFPNQYKGYEITIEIPEYTAICPKTSLPDFGTIMVHYMPDRACLELKSLKMYIHGYRNVGIFYENAVNKILQDIVEACRPVWVRVTGTFAARGGLRSVIEARYPKVESEVLTWAASPCKPSSLSSSSTRFDASLFMAIYAVGDIQGCFNSLRRLLDHISFDPHRDRLWLVGDVVNRGPESLATLRFLRSLGGSACPVLGNHDLFLLAAAENIVKLRPKDTIQDVLAAADRAELIEWLRHQPLHRRTGEFFMVHAGLLPQWTTDDAATLAREVEEVLSGPEYKVLLRELFHGPTPQWDPSLTGMERLVSIVRVFTRLRTTNREGEVSTYSGPPDEAPAGFLPWFRVPNRRSSDATIITGHWAALGLHIEPNVLAIDSGCVWGRQLTAVRLDDRAVYQVEYADRRE